jgi:betaine-homocysteine S-methyltransferase
MSEKAGLLDRLEAGVVLVAEGYLFELERRGYLQAGPYVPEVVLDHPEAVKELHREFLLAGSDVMLALTYYGSREKLEAIGRGGQLEALNRQAVQLAREVAAEGDALVAGDISNTWVYDPRDAEATGNIVRGMYREQVRWAVEEGVDFVIAETLGYLGEGLIALEVIKEFGLPAVINFGSVHTTTKDGYTFADACKIVEDRGADVVGMNCSRGPDTILPIVKEIREAVAGHVAALPVAYRTTPAEPTFQALRDHGQRAFPIGLDPFQTTRFDVANFAVQARDMGVRFIGICCGGAPHHVRAMAEALGKEVPASRYSADMSLHPALGTNVPEPEKAFLEDWKD